MSCFMVSSVLIKKSAIMVLLFPYCNVSFFSSSFKIFSFPLAFSSLTMMCLCVVFLFSYLGFVELLEFIDCFSPNLESFLPLFLQIYLLSPLLSSVSILCIHMILMFPHRPLRLFWLFFHLFLCSLRVFYWPVLKLTDSSAISNFLPSSSSEFWILVLYILTLWSFVFFFE